MNCSLHCTSQERQTARSVFIMLLTLLHLLSLWSMVARSTKHYNNTTPLYVLVLLPYPDARPDSGWDRGLELLPAARVAVREINNDSSILPGYRIELIEKPSDACGVAQSTIGFHNFVYNVLGKSVSTEPIAVMGLACSTVTSAISPIAGREQVGLLQVSMANSHILQDQEKFPHLWRVISAVSVNVNATISLMNRFNWTRVAQLYDGNGIFFRSSADYFRQVMLSDKYDLVLDQAIEEDASFIESAMEQIESTSARIIFVSATVPEAQLLMCEAAKRNLVWPGFVWIFHSRSVNDLVYPECTVPPDQLQKAIENVTLLDLSLDGRREDDVLVSGLTYKNYRAAYLEEFENVYTEFQLDLVNYDLDYNNPFANPMYDEVWALALAINASLPELQSDINSIDRPQLTETLEGHLYEMSFEGAVSKIKFNSLKEAVTPVTFFHVRDGQAIDIGRYDESTRVLLQIYNISEDSFPADDFVVEYKLISFTVFLVYIILAVILAVLTTVMVILMLVLYDTPEVRATSPMLSTLMFIGCYMFICCVILVMVRHSFLINEGAFIVLCSLQRSLIETAYSLIAFTMLFRLIRIYKLFHNSFVKLGRFWKDRWLVCYIIVCSFTPNILHILFFVVINSYQYRTVDRKGQANPPTIIKTPDCGLDNVTLGYYVDAFYAICIIIPTLLVMIVAFRTRKVNYSNFKDTKKIIIYGYFFCALTFIIYSLSAIFRFSELPIVTALLISTSALVEAMAVQLFFFLPKILPSILRKKNYKLKGTVLL